jgi:hypothetical protein
MFKNLPGHCDRTRGRCKFLIVCRDWVPPQSLTKDAVNRDCGELIYNLRQEEEGWSLGIWQSEWSRSESDRSTTDHGKQQTWSNTDS